ncbi:hypothetical protein [Hoeflea olei]|uniref:Uncharacterized protein n=1 Tax=Hoeflea olei TaxID=1480615 RepID=A0A1C1Z041_9HYPH|nr:hypothetical protein [Hoeflea olei]OCW59059.1 hypothetical protein AWJ14_04995 [Hoeflea olei]
MQRYSRFFLVALFSLFALPFAGDAQAQPWQGVDPASAGWSVEKLKTVQVQPLPPVLAGKRLP